MQNIRLLCLATLVAGSPLIPNVVFAQAAGLADTRAQEKNSRKIKQLERKYLMRYGRLRKMNAGKRKYSFDIRTMIVELKNAHKIERMVKECSAKFPGQKIEACEIAANWKESYKKYLPLWAQKRVEEQVHNTKGCIKVLGETGTIYGKEFNQLMNSKAWIAEVRSEIKKVFDHIGIEVAPTVLAPLTTEVSNFKAALKKASKASRWPRKHRHKDRAVKAAAATAFRAAQLKVKKVGLPFPHWTIKKNNYGRPLFRFRNVSVMAQGRGERFCRVYDGLTIQSQHKGGGRYAKPVLQFKGGERFMVSSCR